jgi:hypothetical protein
MDLIPGSMEIPGLADAVGITISMTAIIVRTVAMSMITIACIEDHRRRIQQTAIPVRISRTGHGRRRHILNPLIPGPTRRLQILTEIRVRIISVTRRRFNGANTSQASPRTGAAAGLITATKRRRGLCIRRSTTAKIPRRSRGFAGFIGVGLGFDDGLIF